MTKKSKVPLFILIFLFFTILYWIADIKILENENQIPVIKDVPSLSLTNQNGITFTDQNFLGKVTILDFIFTNCLGPCPMMSNNMKSLYEGNISNPEVQFVSITVDPDRDTEITLLEYSLAYGVNDDRWHFLTGEIESIKSICEDGFLLFSRNLPEGHAIKFVLIDHKGQIRKYYDGTDRQEMLNIQKDLDRFVKISRVTDEA